MTTQQFEKIKEAPEENSFFNDPAFLRATIVMMGKDQERLIMQYKALENNHGVLIKALKDLTSAIDLSKLNVRKDFHLMNVHAQATKFIDQAEGK